jgi:uncharacterized membrane protein YecN with MAPEG domain
MTTVTDMNAAQAASLWCGLLILLLGVFAIRTVLARKKHPGAAGDDGFSEVAAAETVFGNAAQYVPVSIGTLILFYHLELPVVAIHALGATLLAGRVIQARGLGNPAAATSRTAGMALTFIALFACGGILTLNAFA